ncbi:MAG: hypothetical protein JXA28_07135 [Bacteroidetes bacterium]|nr:hypothetical protein [Bacteroidota bacterium]
MMARTVLGALIVLLAMTQAASAGGGSDISKHFNNISREVKATDNPAQKRDILRNSLETMTKALDRVESSALVSDEDRAGAKLLRARLQEKQDELSGTNGFERVADTQLNSFGDYIVQDMQQADQYITVSLVAVLLIVIILILIL